MRILHTADPHIGADLPLRAGGLPRRGADFVDSFRRVLAAARSGVELVIIAGDLFDVPQPGDGAIAAATQPIWELAAAGVRVIIVPGNHERSVLPHALLLSHPNIDVFREPQTVVIERSGLRVAVSGFPCLRRSAAATFAARVAATGWESVAADVRILAVHETFAGARCGPANFQFRTGDDVVPRALVPPGFHYVAAGHIHRHQALETTPGGPPIVYCGSPDRIAFAELDEPKGYVLVDAEPGRVQWRHVTLAVRPMAIVPLDLTGLTADEALGRAAAALDEAASGAVVQVRLSGRVPRNALAGLRLTPALRARRPDVLLSVSSQAVEWVPQREVFRSAGRADRSAFDLLDAPPTPRMSAAREHIAQFPLVCGTYALYDADGRLLYVGKTLRARSRVRTHLRGAGSGTFPGWSRQVARAEVRPAASELEALLVEAELIRRLAPPFNRQMRLWKRYCYLTPQGLYGQLAVTPEPGRGSFGPLRSRSRADAARRALAEHFRVACCPETDAAPENRARARAAPPQASLLCQAYFAGVCGGPCAQRDDPEQYAARLQARDTLLAGLETPELAALRSDLEQIETAAASGGTVDAARELRLRAVLELSRRAAALRRARDLFNALLLMPGNQADTQAAAVVTRTGLHLAEFPRAAHLTPPLVAWYRTHVPAGATTPTGRALPKPIADMLCTAAGVLARGAIEYRLLSPGQVQISTGTGEAQERRGTARRR